MTGLHINWSKPFMRKHNGEFFVEDFELLTTVISALKWREKNGKIKLCADEIAIEYYKSIGILDIYDEVELLKVDDDINPSMFWAAGKLFALRNQTAPVAVIDTDFIVWESIPFKELGDCTVIHFEDLYPDVYPHMEYFKTDKPFFKRKFNWSLPACNTAFAVIKSQALLKNYTDTAIEFMKSAADVDEPLKYMVFAEQRLINMCACEMGIEIKAFSSLERLFRDGEKYFTHIWGMKQQMRDNPQLREAFCQKCRERIRSIKPPKSPFILKGDLPAEQI